MGRSVLCWCCVGLLVCLLASFTEVHGFELHIAPRQVTVRLGEKTSILCRSNVPLTRCRFLLPGDRVVDFSQGAASSSTDEYRYYGRGLNTGQCGITLTKLLTQSFSPVACQGWTEREGWKWASMFLRVTNLPTLQWDIDPQQTAVLRPGQNASFLCLTDVPLSTCRFGFMKEDEWLDLSLGKVSKRTSEYAYYGTGLEYGQCGVTLLRVTMDLSQELRCVGIGDNGEWVGDFFSVVVAREPDFPTLSAVSSTSYRDGDTLSATCTVRHFHPASNITWYLGEEVVGDGITDESPGDAWYDHQSETVVKRMTRRLSCRDHNKYLRCSNGASRITTKKLMVACDASASGTISSPPPPLPIRHTTPSRPTSQVRPSSVSTSGESSACGLPLLSNQLIVNGEETVEGHWPWIAALFVKKVQKGGLEFLCGATLMNKKHVITAAHCVHRGGVKRRPDDMVVFLGKHNLNDWTEPNSQLMRIDSIHVHSAFVSSTNGSDIAILRLSLSAIYNNHVRPICMWNKRENLIEIVGKRGTVVGWGRLGAGDSTVSDTPRLAKTVIVSQEECLRSNPDFVKVTTKDTFCAGFRDGSGPCNGDSGSGLVLPYRLDGGTRTQWFLRGIVSVALSQQADISCDLQEYVVYTDVAKFSKWLQTFTDV